MIELMNDFCLTVFDFLLGWMGDLPSDIKLMLVALLTAAIMTLVRRITTDQDMLHRASADKKRLGVLLREAKRCGDKEAIGRYRTTKSQIALKTFRAEGLPLLVSIIPVAMLATWAWQRLAFHPPAPGEPVRVMAYTPVSAAGQVMHVVPTADLACDGWIRSIDAITNDGPPYGLACWTLQGDRADRSYELTFRSGAESFTREFRIGGRTYAEPVVYHDGGVVTSIEMRPVKLFGAVPGLSDVYFPPWLAGYLVIAIPSVMLFKRLFRVC